MSISELEQLGFSRNFLYKAVRSAHSKKFAVKGTGETAKYRIDTEEFEKARQKGIIR